MKNYQVIEHDDCYELSRKKPVLHNLKTSHYFSKIDFRVSSKKSNFSIDKTAAVELKNYIQNSGIDLFALSEVKTFAAHYVVENCSFHDTLDMIFNIETITCTAELLGLSEV
jgi:hypothetical protein